MATLNQKKFAAAGSDWVTVGNHRQTRIQADGTRQCKLHDSVIVEYDPLAPANMYLDICGHRTTTTRAAMGEFLMAITGEVWAVSFAGDQFSVAGPKQFSALTDGESLGFSLPV